MNTFNHHAVRHGQTLVNDTVRALNNANAVVATCDEIVMSLNSGNIQGAISAAQNARNMAVQVAQATQQLNQTINERLDMASYVLSGIQSHVGELSSALQTIRGSGDFYQNPVWANAQMACQQGTGARYTI
jgi:hypothetical protein